MTAQRHNVAPSGQLTMINEQKPISTTTAQRHKAAGNGLSIAELHTGVRGGNGGITTATGACDVSNPADQGGLRLRGLAATTAAASCLCAIAVKMFIQCNQNNCSASKRINGILYLIDQTLQTACRRTSLPGKCIFHLLSVCGLSFSRRPNAVVVNPLSRKSATACCQKARRFSLDNPSR